MKKCDKNNVCHLLNERMENELDASKGIVVWRLVDTETFEPTRTLIGYKRNKKDVGLIFNFCPWCGGQLGERI